MLLLEHKIFSSKNAVAYIFTSLKSYRVIFAHLQLSHDYHLLKAYC